MAEELITESSGIWSDNTIWRKITYSPTIKTEVDYFPNANTTSVSIEKDVTINGNYTVKSVMTGYSSQTNYLYSQNDSILLTIDSYDRHINLRGGMSTSSNDLHLYCDIFATHSTAPSTGKAQITYSDNATDSTAPKYLTLYKSFKTTEPIQVNGLGAERSFLTIHGDVEAVYNGAYAKMNISKATVLINGDVDVANLTVSSDSSLTLNGKLFAHGISGENLDGVKIQCPAVIGENSGVEIQGSYGNFHIGNGGDVVVNSGAGSLVVPRYLRMDGNSKLTFNTEGALIVDKTDLEDIAPLWFWTGTQTVVFNADAHLRGLCVGPNSKVTVELGENCDLLELDSLTVKLDSDEGYLKSTNSLTFKNFRNNTVKVNSVRSPSELKRIYADGFARGSFYISPDGYLNAFACGTKVIGGFSNTAQVPTVNSSIATRNSDGSLSLNSAGKTGWTTGIKTQRLKPNTQYSVRLTYKIDGSQSNGTILAFVRNQNTQDPSTDYVNSSMNVYDQECTISFNFTTDASGAAYSICIDTNKQVVAQIWDFEVTEEPSFVFVPADAESQYSGEISNIPTGSPEFDVSLPQIDTPEMTPQQCIDSFGLTENVTNAVQIIRNIINYCKNSGIKKVTLPKGNYRENGNFRIELTNMTDFTFDGNGSTIIFNKYLKSSNNANMYVANNTRMKICNFNMDWNWDENPLASIVEVVGLNKSGTNYVDFKFIEYDYFPMRDVRVATLSRYDPETQSVGVEGGYTKSYEMYVGQNIPTVEWLSDNVLRVYVDASSYEIGHLLRMQHSYYEMGGINFQSNSHLTMENVNIYSCSGHAMTIGGTQQYTHFKNVNIVRPPNSERRAITCTADHLHISSSRGYIKIEDCEFSRGADDCINFHDCTTFMYPYSATSLKTMNDRNTYLYAVGQTLEFRHGDYSPTDFSATVVALNVLDAENGIREVVFDRELPEAYMDGFVLFNRAYDTSNIIVRNCYFHDNRARGILILASNVTMENCRFFHNEMGALKFETGYTTNSWCEGHGVNNVVVRNCIFDTVNPTDSASKDGFARDIYFGVYLKQDPSSEQTYYPILSNILLEGNTFYNTYGLAAWIASTGNLIIRDNTFVNEKSRNNPLSYRGAFRVSYSSGTKIINNTYIQSANPMSAGVFYSPVSTAEILVAGNRTIPKPDVSIDLQPEDISLSLSPDEAVTGVLEVSASSYYQKSYQWYMSVPSDTDELVFVAIENQTSPALDLSELQIDQTTYFYCAVSDSTSSVNTRIVEVSVERYINQLGETSKNVSRLENFTWKFEADHPVEKWVFNGSEIDGTEFDQSLGTLSGAVSEGGTHNFSIEATTAEGVSSGSVDYTLNVSENTREYNLWKSSNFTQSELENPEVSGDLATPANDGVTNLQKFAMGFSAKTAVSPSDASLRPVSDPNYDISFEFYKSASVSAEDIKIAIQESDDMSNWTDCPDVAYIVKEVLYPSLKMQAGIKFSQRPAKKFFRLKIDKM